jgi:hypothetical protein
MLKHQIAFTPKHSEDKKTTVINETTLSMPEYVLFVLPDKQL